MSARRLINDSKLFNILKSEFKRQKQGIELIASENFASQGVLNYLGSVFTNKYSEGQPYKRYYGGNKYIDQLETLCHERALKAYRLNPEEWGVNVQPYSGSVANIALYLGVLNLHDRIMGLDLPSGGHLSHGFYTPSKKISKTSVMFESLPYKIKEDGLIDYDKLEENALLFNPKMIICGGSAYPRDWDYKRFRAIADKVNAYLLCDMAHVSGLVAANEVNNPFTYCDFVTTTTHKTLAGPRSGMIFFKKEYANAINESVFPGVQGGPHQNKIAALAYQLNVASTDEFKHYIKRVKDNAKTLARELQNMGFKISTDGTDNHIVLVDLKNKGISGSKFEKVCELAEISVNKNTVYGDKNAMNPSGVRLGTAAMTSRECGQNEMKQIASFLNDVAEICVKIQEEKGKKLVDFNRDIENNVDIHELRGRVNSFSEKLHFPSDEPKF